MSTETKTDIASALEKLGIGIRAVFIPFSKSRNRGEKHRTLNWSVTLTYRGRDVLTTDYSAGIAHCPGYKSRQGDSGYERDKRCELETEKGRAFGTIGATGAPILPDTADVLYSLVTDSSVLDAGGFEQWATDCGYDTDSRKAEAIYRVCLELALKMRAAIGDEVMAQLRELFRGH